MRHWLSHIAIGAVFLLGGSAFSEELNVGDIAPNWMLVDHNNKAVSLYEQVGDGKIAVMVFWASWCAHSKKLLPRLKQLEDTGEFENVAFYLMNVWENGDARAFIREHARDMPVVLHADSIARRFEIDVTPGIVIVNPDRRILYKYDNGGQNPDLAGNIQQVLNSAASTATARPVGAHR